ncbi:MAG: hypothetical protein ACRDPJ_13530, partial [Nocardioidaceae bacterium]
VACHFAGEYGAMPTSPITLNVLGVDQDGTPVEGAAPSAEDLNKPGFSDTWTDVASLTSDSSTLATRAPADNRADKHEGGEGGTIR